MSLKREIDSGLEMLKFKMEIKLKSKEILDCNRLGYRGSFHLESRELNKNIKSFYNHLLVNNLIINSWNKF